ncbi:gluconokinase [Okibacterium endophyticum]
MPATADDARSPHLVVMGVSGSGKSTIGALIAAELDVPFIDGDSLHPLVNIEKMAAGEALDDEDRAPWLAAVGRTMAGAGEHGLVVACSALRRAYRDIIRENDPTCVFIHLSGDAAVLSARLEGRSGHFMPESLLASQLDTLEGLEPDEPGVVVDIGRPIREIVRRAVEAVRAGVL